MTQDDSSILDKVKIHDSRHFEVKQEYLFNVEKTNEYHVKIYFFVPKNFRIDSSNYSREQFFNDLHSYIRFKIPVYSMEYFIREDRTLETMVSHLSKQKISEFDREEALNCIKLYTMIVKTMMVNTLREMKKAKRTGADDLAEQYFRYIPALIEKYRSYRTFIESSVIDEICNVYNNCDEYLGMKICSRTNKILYYLKKTDLTLYRKWNDQFFDMVEQETAYMKSRGYLVAGTNKKDNNLLFIHRQGRLKKIANSVLFLETRFGKSSLIIQQLAYSVAAGVAMIFATAAAFFGHVRYGEWSYPFFVALVVSYMFKDRIKDILKLYFSKTMTNSLYDRVRNVLFARKKKIGYFKESATYIDYEDVPSDIRSVRDADYMGSVPIKEEIILYRKYLKVRPGIIRKNDAVRQYRGIVDILRFNVSNFIRNLDDPEKRLLVNANRKLRIVAGKRIYRLNVIIHYRVGHLDHYRRMIVNLTSEGIHDIIEF